MLNSTGDLEAAQLAFFVPALLGALFMMFRHGFSKQVGWYYLTILSLMRLIGASCLLYSETQHDYSNSLLTAYGVTSSLGAISLLLAVLGFCDRVGRDTRSHRLSALIFRIVHIVSLVGLILIVVGETDEGNKTKGDYSEGRTLVKAGAVVFFAICILIAIFTLGTAKEWKQVPSAERKLLLASVLALPLVLIRLIYVGLVAFSGPGSPFFIAHISVWAKAFMIFLPEAIGVSMFLVAGWLTPRLPPSTDSNNVDMNDSHAGEYPSHENRPSHKQPQVSILDYRPRKLIRNAVNDHILNSRR